MRRIVMALLIGCLPSVVRAQVSDATRTDPRPTLNVVATAHLDTQWRWTIRNTIDEYVPATFQKNLDLMDLFPDYKFSFEGAFRYMLLREYRPDLYKRVKPYIASGRWRVAGSWVDAVDVNVPSFESLVRHALYGNGFFKREFGVTSRDVFLPDCFGFGYALPAIASHCGLKSFSTQKLAWGSSVGIPFDIGIWEGVGGATLIAGLNAGDYTSKIQGDLSRDTSWVRKIEHQKDTSGLAAQYMYFGTGDTGGSPDSTSVAWLEKSIHGDGPIHVRSIGSDDLVDVAMAADTSKLPHFHGELLMTHHGVGCYTSEAAMKRWNRKNELLADAAERASVIATLVSGEPYPREMLRDTWQRFLWHQFHDDVTGTSIPEAYVFSWNDEILCQNRFAGILEHAVEATTPMLDTRATGQPLSVFNPLAIRRNDMVSATVLFPGGAPAAVAVFDPKGKEVPAQVVSNKGDSVHVVFLADVPSVGYAVYDVRPAAAPRVMATGLSVTEHSLENAEYRVSINDNGDVASIYDKRAQRELLSQPIEWQLLFDQPEAWPAWEIDYSEIQAAPRALVGAPAQIEITEKGPARVALTITRKTEHSTFRTIVSLAAGSAGRRVTFENEVDWYERETLLKAAFHLSTPNAKVTYDLGLGTAERGINTKKLYEVPGHQWADMTARDGSYGVSILNDCRYGWDHPDSGTVRLSLIHTPGVHDSWNWVGDQKSMDNGHQTFAFAVYGHPGDWRRGATVWEAARLNQPLLAFQTGAHPGVLGKSYSLLNVQTTVPGVKDKSNNAPSVFVNAIKFAEDKDDLVVRLRELSGNTNTDVKITCVKPIVATQEVNGSEDPIGSTMASRGALQTSMRGYGARAFALQLGASSTTTPSRLSSTAVAIPYDMDGISLDDNRTDGDFESGNTIAGDLLPAKLDYRGVPFAFGPTAAGSRNVLRCRGQALPLPSGKFNRLDMLVTAVGGPAEGTFQIGGKDTTIWIQDYAEPIAQWNSRMIAGEFMDDRDQIAPAYINPEPIAWYGTHRHNAKGENEAYQFTYLYLLSLPLSDGAPTLRLPDNPRIRIFAATAANSPYDDIRAAQPLYDEMRGALSNIVASRKTFVDSIVVQLDSPIPGAVVHYTLDGSAPMASSPQYSAPIVLMNSTTVKSRAILAGADDSHVTSANFYRLAFHDAATVNKTKPGLMCAYYEGSWDRLPKFDSLTSVKEDLLPTVTLPGFARQEDFGLTLDGYVAIPTDGLYDFFLSSDDGSALTIDDTLLVDNDGLHGTGDVAGAIALKAGAHRLRVRMFQKKGDEGLTLTVEGPGVPKQAVPAEWLSHVLPRRARAAR
jgi:alpha-mannosidase